MFKIGKMFSCKSQVPKYLVSGVGYMFTCAGCIDSYVGETARYFDTRVHEHLHKASCQSSIFKHQQDYPICKNKCDETCFKIIDRANTKFTLQVKEAIHTNWLKPKITKQIKLDITIDV